MPAQGIHHCVRKRNGATTVRSLGVIKYYTLQCVLHGMTHLELRPIEIHISPLQGDQLALTHASRQNERNQRLQPLAPHGREELASLLLREDRHFLPLDTGRRGDGRYIAHDQAHLKSMIECIWRVALAALDLRGQLDWTMAFLDGSFAPAKNGGEKVGLTRKGTKWMLVVDGNGLRLGFYLDGANHPEVRLAEQTLDTIRVARLQGRPKQRPEKLVADRGYESAAFRRALRGRGMRMCIAPRRRPKHWKPQRGRPVVARKDDYRLRYRVERSFAWLGAFRRLLIRWERLFHLYRSFFAFAVVLLCVKRLAHVKAETPAALS